MKGGERRPTKEAENLPKMTQMQGADAKKLRTIKELEDETRCHSSRSYIRDVKEKTDTSRTRSVSPAVIHSSPLKTNLPVKKFHQIYSKIIVQLESVKNISSEKKNEAENLIDLRRQLQRADEFSIRFSRNNLYEIKRILYEVKKLLFALDSLSHEESKILCRKIILGYQATSQALQTYINYARNPSNIEVPEKINELILLVADLFLCCEHFSLPPEGLYVQNDAVRICNEVLALLRTKTEMNDCVVVNTQELTRKSSKIVADESTNARKFSMYKSKLTNSKSKMKSDTPKRMFGISSVLGCKAKKMKNEKNARITHEIYTQKMNMRTMKELGSKIVKFEQPRMGLNEKGENAAAGEKKPWKKTRFTPREVRSQDDDVETMIQTIADDEVVTARGAPPPIWEEDVESDASNYVNKNNIRELLLEAIEELKNPDKKEQKSTLKKLLNSIQNCSRSQNGSPRPPKVKVYHFKSKDLEEDTKVEEKENLETETHQNECHAVDLMALHEKLKAREEMLARERRLNTWFKPLKTKKVDYSQEEVVPRGKIKLKIAEDSIMSINNYRKSFHDYKKNNIMYKTTLANKPWDLMGKVSDTIILDLLGEIALDFQNDAILRRLYFNELLEVSN